MTSSRSYAEWNMRLLEVCVENSVDTDGRFYLNIHEMLDDEDSGAEERFRITVAEKYASLLSLFSDPVSRLAAQRDPDGRPLCAAFLGVCVLAAERMTDTGYYAALRTVLDQPNQSSLPPSGFVKESFEVAWQSALGNWLRKQGLYVQPPPYDQQRFVRLPKMHALLRAGDLSKLPDFFVYCNYKPASQFTPERLQEDFKNWLSSRQSRITEIGKAAWRDPARQPGILKQIIRTLECWDGIAREFTRGSAVQRCYVSLRLEPKRGYALFQAPRKSGFPDRFPFAGGTMVASDEENYKDLLVPSTFSSQITKPYESVVGSFRMSFRGAQVFVFVNDGPGMGYDQTDRLVLGENCAVLFRATLMGAVKTFLKNVTDESLTERDLVNSLPGWSCYADFRPTRQRLALGELAPLGVVARQYPRFVGGVRIGLQQIWLEEAPPARIEAAGRPSSQVMVDGMPLFLQDEQFADVSELSWSPGLHEVVLGERRFIRIIAARLKDAGGSGLLLSSEAEIEAALDQARVRSSVDYGLFIGSAPGQIAASPSAGHFQPQWRLNYDDGMPSIVALSSEIAAPQATRRCSRPQALWSRSILRFANGRIGASTSKISASEARQAWRHYVERALELHVRQTASRSLIDD